MSISTDPTPTMTISLDEWAQLRRALIDARSWSTFMADKETFERYEELSADLCVRAARAEVGGAR